MSNVVVDSSVVIKWFVVEPHSAEARRLLSSYLSGTLEFLVPDLLYAEIGNIVWKKHRLQGLSTADAQQIIDAFRTMTFTATAASTLLEDAYRLATMHQRSVYDALYLALALRENCQFVTADQRLVNALGAGFPGVVWIGNWP